MRLTLGLLADAANVTAENKINILGEFNLIQTPVLPVTLASFTLVLRLEADANEPAEHTFGVRLLDDDGDLVTGRKRPQRSRAPHSLPQSKWCGIGCAKRAAQAEYPW